MRKNKNERKTKKRSIKLNIIKLLIIVVILIFITPKFVSFARYVYNFAYEHYIASKDFYFTSDKLGDPYTEYEVTNNWSGAESYTVIVNLSSKKNDMALTIADIDYTVSATHSNNITCTLNKNSGTIVGTGNSGSNVDAVTVTIEPANGVALPTNAEVWVEVTATATSPYTKTLRGKLIFEVGASDISYEIIDAPNQPYLTVNIVNSTATAANVTLSYSPTVVLLDMTSRFYLNSSANTTQAINSYNYINSITSSVNGLSTSSVKFYKTDSTQDYSYSGGSATPIITLTTSNGGGGSGS